MDHLIFSLYTDQTTMTSDLSNGIIQLAIDLPPAQIQGLRSAKNVSVQACAQKAFDYLSFNCYTGASGGNPVLRDWKFRNALNWAIDKQKLVSLAYDGNATPGSSLFEPDFYAPRSTGTGRRRRARPTPTTSRRPATCSPRRAIPW